MTERFKMEDIGFVYDNGTLIGMKEIVECLNRLHDENHQLKRQIGNLEHTKDFCADVCADCERLEKENEQLKQEINMLKITIGRNETYINRLTHKSEWRINSNETE